MTDFKKLIADDIEISASEAALKHYPDIIGEDECIMEMYRQNASKDYKSGATRYASLLEKALDALRIYKGFGYAGKYPADETIADITAELTNKENE